MSKGLCAAVAVGALALGTTGAGAVNVYVFSSGDAATDSAAIAALMSRGHTATLGVEFSAFDGTVSLAGFQTVYLQNNFNWAAAGLMPDAGQQQLVGFVNAGGRLVTSEWVIYYSFLGSRFGLLGPILPAEQSFLYGENATVQLTQVTPDSRINAGLPASFTCPLTSYAGTDTDAMAKPGAIVYYSTSNSASSFGLAGWEQGSGLVFSFTTTCGPAQVGDANFGRLFSNVMGITGPAPCYANCDGSTGANVLNVNDFVCFQARFAAADPYADCDHSSALNVNDFVCFQQQFAAGCR